MKKLSLIALLAAAPMAANAADINGMWLTEEGKAHVAMEPCGVKLCGKIVWLKQPTDANGKPQADVLNEDTSLRGRPVVGIKILEVAADGANSWKGTVYNPEDGKSYSSEVSLKSDGKLVVKGCVAGGLLCEDETWTKM